MKTPTENTQEQQKSTVQRVQRESSNGGNATITDNRTRWRGFAIRAPNTSRSKLI